MEEFLDGDVEDVIEIDDSCIPPDDDDDDDQQSTSNASEMHDEVVDDSVYELKAHEQDCFAVSVAGSRWMITGGEDDVAYLFDQSNTEPDPVLKIEHDDSVTYAIFNHKETLVATADMSGKIIVTSLKDLKSCAVIAECGDLEWICWHISSDILFCGDSDGVLWMWLIGPQGIVQQKVMSCGATANTCGVVLPDGRRVLCGYADGSLRLWDVRNEASVQFNFPTPVTAIAHHPTQFLAAIGLQNGLVVLLGTSEEGELKRLMQFSPFDHTRAPEEQDELEQCVECLAFSSSHPWLAVGRNDGSVFINTLDCTSPRSIFRTPQALAITRVACCVEGNVPVIVCGSVDGIIRIIDGRDGSVYKEWGNGGDGILDMTVVQTNPLRIITAGAGGVIRVFDASVTE